MARFKLYTTLGCHLCEQAEHMLRTQPPIVAADWEPVEIADSQELINAYGIRIPVVQCVASGRELNWPFTAQELNEWLQAQVD